MISSLFNFNLNTRPCKRAFSYMSLPKYTNKKFYWYISLKATSQFRKGFYRRRRRRRRRFFSVFFYILCLCKIKESFVYRKKSIYSLASYKFNLWGFAYSIILSPSHRSLFLSLFYLNTFPSKLIRVKNKKPSSFVSFSRYTSVDVFQFKSKYIINKSLSLNNLKVNLYSTLSISRRFYAKFSNNSNKRSDNWLKHPNSPNKNFNIRFKIFTDSNKDSSDWLKNFNNRTKPSNKVYGEIKDSSGWLKHPNNRTKPSNNRTKPSNNRTKLSNNRTKLSNNRTKSSNNSNKPSNNWNKTLNYRTQTSNNPNKSSNNWNKSLNYQTKTSNNPNKPSNNRNKLFDNWLKHPNNRTKLSKGPIKYLDVPKKRFSNNRYKSFIDQMKSYNNRNKSSNNRYTAFTDQVKSLNFQTKSSNNQIKPSNNRKKPSNNRKKPSNKVYREIKDSFSRLYYPSWRFYNCMKYRGKRVRFLLKRNRMRRRFRKYFANSRKRLRRAVRKNKFSTVKLKFSYLFQTFFYWCLFIFMFITSTLCSVNWGFWKKAFSLVILFCAKFLELYFYCFFNFGLEHNTALLEFRPSTSLIFETIISIKWFRNYSKLKVKVSFFNN